MGALVLLGACSRGPVGGAVQPAPERPAAQPPAPTTAEPPPVQRWFTWEAVAVVDDTIDGPGVVHPATEALFSVRRPDGSVQRVRVAGDLECEEECGAPFEEVGGEARGEFGLGPWVFPGDPEPPEDLALLGASLAVPQGIALPDRVPYRMEVRYHKAQCDEGDDDGTWVLIRDHTTPGDDPVAEAPALAGLQRFPRRVVTVTIGELVLHFVSVSKFRPPRSRRMADVKSHEVEFWILEGSGREAKTIHHNVGSSRGASDANSSFACMLSWTTPVPWDVVDVKDETFVLTRSSINRFERWKITPDGIELAGHWTGNVTSLF